MRRKTIEDYVEILYHLQKNRGKVHTNDIASVFDISPASVTEVIQKLSKDKYVNYEKYRGTSLTEKGTRLAKKIKKRHTTLKDFLMLIGVDESIAEKDACEMEHILHPTTMDSVVKFVEVIEQCKVTPFWLARLKEYVKTGELSKCPSELAEICLKYAKKIK